MPCEGNASAAAREPPTVPPPEILEVALSVPSRHCATRLSRGDWPCDPKFANQCPVPGNFGDFQVSKREDLKPRLAEVDGPTVLQVPLIDQAIDLALDHLDGNFWVDWNLAGSTQFPGLFLQKSQINFAAAQLQGLRKHTLHLTAPAGHGDATEGRAPQPHSLD